MSKMRLCTIHKHQQPPKRPQRSAQSCPAQDVNTATYTALRWTEEINDKEEWEQHEKDVLLQRNNSRTHNEAICDDPNMIDNSDTVFKETACDDTCMHQDRQEKPSACEETIHGGSPADATSDGTLDEMEQDLNVAVLDEPSFQEYLDEESCYECGQYFDETCDNMNLDTAFYLPEDEDNDEGTVELLSKPQKKSLSGLDLDQAFCCDN